MFANQKVKQTIKLGGFFQYKCPQLLVGLKVQGQTFPEGFFNFPAHLLLTFLMSSLFKVAVPFSLEWLYNKIGQGQVLQPLFLFVILIALNYFSQLKSQQLLTQHKLKVTKILRQRAIKTSIISPFSCLYSQTPSISTWSKICSNISKFVNNYYSSYLSLVFESIKIVLIVAYLLARMGVVVLIGIIFGLAIAKFTIFISGRIQPCDFLRFRLLQKKTNLLTEYFSRIVDYQMSWLDGFVAEKIQTNQQIYQRNLTKAKMLDAWCVGLWQFTQIGISSLVLCLYYIYSQESNSLQINQTTVVYLFQMLTFPMNAISWNIAGLRSATQAIMELDQWQRSVEAWERKNKKIHKFDFGNEAETISTKIQPGKIYALSSNQTNFFRKLSLCLSQKQKIGYAEENGFLLPTAIQTLFMTLKESLNSSVIDQSVQKMVKILQVSACEELPFQNLTSTFSGGQKMRLSLARALFHSKILVIDSDLTSLDKNTRGCVFGNLRILAQRQGISVIMKDKEEDDQILQFADEFIKVDHRFSRVLFTANKKCFCPSSKKQHNQQVFKMIEQKLRSSISNIQIAELPMDTKHQKMDRKLSLTLKTFKFYFHHQLYHFMFIASLIAMYGVGNYYNYYVSIAKPTDPFSYAYSIFYITVVYIICIILRSLLFAKANLKQSARISNLTNNISVFNHIDFYSKLHIIDNSPESPHTYGSQNQQNQQINHKKNQPTEKLTSICTSDIVTVNNSFPFSTNILWNNIATVFASLIVICLEVPWMLLFGVLIFLLIKQTEKTYRSQMQSSVHESKNCELGLMRIVNNIDKGAHYIQTLHKTTQFIDIFNCQLGKDIKNGNKQLSLTLWVKKNFRFNMLIFLCLSLVLFQVFGRNQSEQSRALMNNMIRYILLLSDYIFHLAMSLTECKSQAISIQRIRRLIENPQARKGSIDRMKRVNERKNRIMDSCHKNQEQKYPLSLIKLSNFSYEYDQNCPSVLKNLNLEVNRGQRIVLKGKTGAGKTTLFKILMGLYPEIYFPDDNLHITSFSSQHPLLIGDSSVLERVDPYKILDFVSESVNSQIKTALSDLLNKQSKLSFAEEVRINNIRAYLYGHRGITLYDQPVIIPNLKSTYLVVTHHAIFEADQEYLLDSGKLIKQQIKK